MIKSYISKYIRLFIFWMLLFTLFRVVFVAFNYSYSNDTPLLTLLKSFIVALRLDASFTGYIVGIIIAVQIVVFPFIKRPCFKCIDVLNYLLIPLVSIFLLSDINLYSYWGRHVDLEAIEFLKTPAIVLASLRWYEMFGFVVIALICSSAMLFLYKKWLMVDAYKAVKDTGWKTLVLTYLIILFSAAVLIIPVRGSFSVAPINTGVAYFSSYRFANHTAINSCWNLAYSMKKMDATKVKYHYMDDEDAQSIYSKMMHQSGSYEHVLNTKRPNVVIILLESFAAQAIESLGGDPITPNLNSLVKDGILFSNYYAAANRSDKGLVAALTGYQVLPSYSIIRFPEKTINLPFLPQKLKANGYNDLMYMYGGDIKFKNMNSFVTQAGFESIISIDDFPDEFQGEKWGVHDEYTFRKLADEMAKAKEPYFHFFFTLSSHEPYDVPMERMYENDYHNSIAYTDKCIGEFFASVKERGLWDNTLFVLLADHGVPGAQKLTLDMQEYNHIPMIWTGGAVAKKDTVITKIASQTDMAETVLKQLDIETDEFLFSKNIFDSESEPFAFFIVPSNSMAVVEPNKYQVYNNNLKRFTTIEGKQSATDSLKAKAYLQVLYNDSKKR